MFISEMGRRECDSQGCGHYGASRGSRTHKGVDLCRPDGTSLRVGTPVQLGFSGRVVKVGYPYGGAEKSHIRYVAVKLSGEYYCRLFYVKPDVDVGYLLNPDTIVGESQELGCFYNGITEHVHVEFYKLKNPQGGEHDRNNFEYVDPNVALEVLR